MMNTSSVRNIYKLVLFFCLVAAISSCKSSKTIVSNDGSVVSKTHDQVVKDVLSAETDYKTISGKISLEMISGSKTSGMKVNSQLKIVRDEIIQLSIRAPFINSEVFRVSITPDSVYVIDRLSKKYAVENIKDLEQERGIQFNYNNLQALFTDALFIPGKSRVVASDYNTYDISMNGGKYHLETKDKTGLSYRFVIDPNDRVSATHITAKDGKYSLRWMYSDFVKESASLYPTTMEANVDINKKKVKLIMSNSGLDFNKELTVDNSLPSKYTKVSVLDILKNYIK
ncbi:DUF4292 domain-containing protein [Dysgonomonas sp. HGC4]|uniref:DUF4292 domain-containing protein n=1 Tax=Dysgonomonas sp. HGC4 TaxID=1658009 RepID=UPI0009E4C023|nr:DUF4292 domain-containing protein [Dysgonomonas sp. HGC4]MBD8349880.1 DUF4292 domain-containing protein [Dysgonomonas sp. HGC4]